jgi:hypothetical protein
MAWCAVGANASAMMRRSAVMAGIATKLGKHSFRATRITVNLKGGGTLEKAVSIVKHVSTRSIQLDDRGHDEVSLSGVQRIAI